MLLVPSAPTSRGSSAAGFPTWLLTCPAREPHTHPARLVTFSALFLSLLVCSTGWPLLSVLAKRSLGPVI